AGNRPSAIRGSCFVPSGITSPALTPSAEGAVPHIGLVVVAARVHRWRERSVAGRLRCTRAEVAGTEVGPQPGPDGIGIAGLRVTLRQIARRAGIASVHGVVAELVGEVGAKAAKELRALLSGAA